MSVNLDNSLENLKMRLNELVVIDIEASGFGPKSYPIEVALAHVGGCFSDSFLINPNTAHDWTHWNDDAEKIHGIKHSQLIEEGISVIDAAGRLNSLLSENRVVSDNAHFDEDWINELFRAADEVPYFKIDSLQDELGSELISEMNKIKQKGSRKHRALDDVYQIIDEVKQALNQLNDNSV